MTSDGQRSQLHISSVWSSSPADKSVGAPPGLRGATMIRARTVERAPVAYPQRRDRPSPQPH